MSFDLTPKQAYAFLKLKDNKTTELGYGGGAGGGKSFLGCFWIIHDAQAYPGTAWAIGRKELTNLKKTTLLSFYRVLESLKINPDNILFMNSQTNIMNFHNGSSVFLLDMARQPSDPLYTRFGGLELTGAFIDESNENELQAIEIIKTRLGRVKNKEYNILPKILETFNPAKNHVYSRYYKPYKEKILPKHRVFIPALATDNPFLSETYIDQLKRADKITRERLLHGNFEYDDDPTRIFNYDAIIDMFTNGATPDRNRYCSVDVAGRGRDKTFVTIWNGLFIEKIMCFDNITSLELDTILLKYKVPRSKCVIDEDGVGFGLVNEMKGVRGFVNNASPIKTKSETQFKYQNYRNLKSQCWFLLSNYVNNGKIGIYREIPQEYREMLIEDLEQIKHKNPGKDQPLEIISKEEIKESIGRSTDIGDSIMMRMLFEVKEPYIPRIV